MLKELFFSVVIPLYNKEDYIENTLNSVLNQNYKNFEIVIINDGSTDRSIDVVKRFLDSRIKIFNQKNKGLSNARNSGIKHAKYEYIAFLDADDLWCEDYLMCIFNLIKHQPSSEVLATGVKVLRPKQKANLSTTAFKPNQIQIVSNYFSLKKNIFGPSALVIKKSVFKNIGAFNETIKYGEEEDFFIRCFLKYNITFYKVKRIYYLRGFNNQLTSPNSSIKRNPPDYSKYLTNKNQATLKPYIDFIYFKLLILYKMERNDKLVKFYKEKIDVSNLSFIRKIKFYLPIRVFYYLKSFYLSLLKR
ncbi:glycosyltransferase family 2 protein [Algibacter pectinivorans]|uniref:Glycosyltransferase involved in cell wall bisynthesis n=1 Tax=Algibacter pectinivorans TaxID=870482 RepID=A0A1I1QHP9_9FLAO|nr:glycosyltransferase family A protein [Algibacter pectinivorans]SFD17650.1 Glycosyltransferase involved in cell wall bisynthesis [Algibacter pectinivorans]